MATTVTGWPAVDEAHNALRAAVSGVGPSDWDLPTPCEEWTVAQVTQHAAGDQIAYAAAITGGPGPSANPFAPSGQIEGPAADLVEAALQMSAAAWAAVDTQEDAVPTPLPQGPMPAQVAAGACALDAAVHAWDIALATGQPSPLRDGLAQALLPVARAIVEPLRAYGAYAPAIPADPADVAGPVAELLRYLGRRPGWTPASS